MESASRQGVARTEAPGQEGTCLACGPERKRRPEPGPRERAGRGGAGSETGLGCGATGASTAGTPRAWAAEPAKGPHMEDGPGIHRYRAVRPEQDAARRKQPENQKELLEMRTTLPSEKTQSKTEVNLPESGIKTERWKIRENSQEAWRLHPRRALVQVPAVPGRGPRGGRGRGGGAGPPRPGGEAGHVSSRPSRTPQVLCGSSQMTSRTVGLVEKGHRAAFQARRERDSPPSGRLGGEGTAKAPSGTRVFIRLAGRTLSREVMWLQPRGTEAGVGGRHRGPCGESPGGPGPV